MTYILIAFFLIVISLIAYTSIKLRKIRQNGVETDAVVSRIKEQETTDADTLRTSVSYFYYVTFRTQEGEEKESCLLSGKNFDFKAGKKAWDSDLELGKKVRILYDPADPEYVIRLSDNTI